jgi:hypothetical protein
VGYLVSKELETGMTITVEQTPVDWTSYYTDNNENIPSTIETTCLLLAVTKHSISTAGLAAT